MDDMQSDIVVRDTSPRSAAAKALDSLAQQEEKANRSNKSGRQRVLIVNNVLPVTLSKDDSTGQWTATWNRKKLRTDVFGTVLPNIALSDDLYDIVHIGCPEIYISPDEAEAVEKAMANINCRPVFLDPEMGHLHFQGFCKGTLWPIFHNVIDVYNKSDLQVNADISGQKGKLKSRGSGLWATPQSWSPASQDQCWPAYCNVNRLFARVLVECFNEGDIIWIHDYHLLVLPSYLLRKLPQATVGIFLHVPFPSSEIFRNISNREDILRGMLNANHIGFHLFEYARHFLTACKRILGTTYSIRQGGYIEVDYNGRHVMISCSHMGIDPGHVKSVLNTPAVEKQVEELRKEKGACTIFASIDMLERLKGLQLKLLAFQRFLSRNPSFAGHVKLIQIGTTPDSRPDDFTQTRAEVMQLVEVINKEWGKPGDPIVIFQENTETDSFDYRMALLRVADVFFGTAVREGFSLLPFVYTLGKQLQNQPGISILSEFSASSRVLNGAMRINPWNIDGMADAIVKAVRSTPDERAARMERDLDYINSKTTGAWAQRVIEDIVLAHNQDADHVQMGIGWGFSLRMIQMRPGFKCLDDDEFLRNYRSAKRRLLLFDYGGTLVPTVQVEEFKLRSLRSIIRNVDGKARTPLSSPARRCLEVLCGDARNVVVIVSNASRELLEHEFGSIPRLGIVSDNGYYYLPGVNNPKWMCLAKSSSTDDSWKALVESILETYKERTNGAYVLRTESCVVYDFNGSDPEFGALQAKELTMHLESVLQNYPVEVSSGKGFVQVQPEGVSKGGSVAAILAQYKYANCSPDFIFAVGDDVTDESAFEVIQAYGRDNTSAVVHTATIGQKPSVAQAYLNGIDDLHNLLDSLKTATIKYGRNMDYDEFQAIQAERNKILGQQVTPVSPKSRASNKLDADALRRSFGSATNMVNAFASQQDISDTDASATEDKTWLTTPGGIASSATAFLVLGYLLSRPWKGGKPKGSRSFVL